jgi:hypothetical protein
MNIRPFDEQDVPQVIALWTEVFAYPDPHNDPAESIRRKVAVKDDLFLVAVEDSKILGTVMGGYDGHRGWVYSLAVDPANRRKGIGTALMRELERRLKNLGCPKLNLQILNHNMGVVAFYESLGYKVEERVSMGKRFIGGEPESSK